MPCAAAVRWVGRSSGVRRRDRPRDPAGDGRVHEDGAVVAGHPLHQPQATGLLLLDVQPGRAVEPLAHEGGHLQPHGVVAEEGVAEAQHEGAHVVTIIPDQALFSRSTTSPRASRTVTSSGICPGRLWVAQPKQGS